MFTEMLVNGFVRKIFLYVRNSTTNEILERWDFVVECEELVCDRLIKNDLFTVQKNIRIILQQICSTANRLPLLVQNWKYTITFKLEESLMSNIETLEIPKTWFKNKNAGDVKNNFV